MAKIKQSVSWWCFVRENFPPEKFVKETARIGFQGIELCPPDSWELIRDSGMQVATIGGHATLEDGLNRTENHDRIEKEIRQNIEKAKEFGISALICFSGNRYGATDEEGARATAAGLKRVARDAEQAGVLLILELLNSRVDHKGYQCDRTEWGVGVCKEVGSPQVKLLYDIYHMQIMEGDLIRTIRNNIEHIGHFHTAGNPGRNDMDGTQEIYYPPIYRAIEATGYTGFVGHEFIPLGDPVAALQSTYNEVVSA